MSVQDLKDLILGWIPDNVMRLISPERARNAYYSIIDFFWDVTGDKSDLETTDKSTLVNAINELKQSVDGATGFDITEIILSNGQSFLFPAMKKGHAFVIRIIEYDGSSQEGIPSPDGMVWLGGYDGVGVGNDTVVICVSNSVGGSYSDVGYQFVIINQGKDSEVIFVDELPDENLAKIGVIYVLNSNNAMYIWDSQQSDYVLIGDVVPGTLISSTVFEDENNNVVIPEPNKLYFDTTSEIYYRWNGSEYVLLNQSDYDVVRGKGFIGRSVTARVGGSYVVDFDDMAEHYILTMTDNTSIMFDNMITEDETVVITLTVTGNYSLLLPSFLVASFENDDYDGSMNNEIVINIKRGGANPQGYYTLKSYEI